MEQHIDNNELLAELKQRIARGTLSEGDVRSMLTAAHHDAGVRTLGERVAANFTLTKILYGIGAIVAILGLIYFVGIVWSDIGSLGHIVVTLGAGMLLAALGSMLLHTPERSGVGAIFHLLGGALIPAGVIVTINELIGNTTTLWPFVYSFGAVALMYALLMYAQRHMVLTFFTTAHTTAAAFLLVGALLDGAVGLDEGLVMSYFTMLVGFCYLAVGYQVRHGWSGALTGAFYLFGSGMFFVSAFSRMFDERIWEFFYVLPVAAGVALAVHLKSKAILTTSTIALFAYIVYLSNEYFADTLGWPIVLIVLGFVFIGLGYASARIGQQYLT